MCVSCLVLAPGTPAGLEVVVLVSQGMLPWLGLLLCVRRDAQSWREWLWDCPQGSKRGGDGWPVEWVRVELVHAGAGQGAGLPSCSSRVPQAAFDDPFWWL